MSSLEIAEVTGKDHGDVLKDIRVRLLEDGIAPQHFFSVGFDDLNNRCLCYRLPVRELGIAVASYPADCWVAIRNRWNFIETGKDDSAEVEREEAAANLAMIRSSALQEMQASRDLNEAISILFVNDGPRCVDLRVVHLIIGEAEDFQSWVATQLTAKYVRGVDFDVVNLRTIDTVHGLLEGYADFCADPVATPACADSIMRQSKWTKRGYIRLRSALAGRHKLLAQAATDGGPDQVSFDVEKSQAERERFVEMGEGAFATTVGKIKAYAEKLRASATGDKAAPLDPEQEMAPEATAEETSVPPTMTATAGTCSVTPINATQWLNPDGTPFAPAGKCEPLYSEEFLAAAVDPPLDPVRQMCRENGRQRSIVGFEDITEGVLAPPLTVPLDPAPEDLTQCGEEPDKNLRFIVLRDLVSRGVLNSRDMSAVDWKIYRAGLRWHTHPAISTEAGELMQLVAPMQFDDVVPEDIDLTTYTNEAWNAMESAGLTVVKPGQVDEVVPAVAPVTVPFDPENVPDVWAEVVEAQDRAFIAEVDRLVTDDTVTSVISAINSEPVTPAPTLTIVVKDGVTGVDWGGSDGQVKTMSSLEIAEVTGKRHDNVMRDIKAILDEAGIGALKFEGTYRDGQNKERPCYHLPRFECDLVISGYSVKYRAAIIRRWHELEAKEAANTPPVPVLPLTYVEALRAHLQSVETIEVQAQQLQIQTQELAEAAPKVDYYDKFLNSKGLASIRKTALALRIPERKFINACLDLGIMYRGADRKLMPYSPWASEEVGYMRCVPKLDKLGREVFQTMFTARGMPWAARKIGDSWKGDAAE